MRSAAIPASVDGPIYPVRRHYLGSGRVRVLLAGLLVVLLVPALAGCGSGGKPQFVVGAVEDAAKYAPDPRTQMRLARDGNLRVIALSAVWRRDSDAAADLPTAPPRRRRGGR